MRYISEDLTTDIDSLVVSVSSFNVCTISKTTKISFLILKFGESFALLTGCWVSYNYWFSHVQKDNTSVPFLSMALMLSR